MKPTLQKTYEDKIAPAMAKDFSIANKMRIPKLKKVLVSMCLKEALTDRKVLDRAVEELSLITGQRPKITRSKKDIANFKLRVGMPMGCVSTMRGARMYEFVERFINVTLPRVRDFRGLPSKGFDGAGNYSVGMTEQIIFPEINFDKVEKARGMNITFVTSANNDKEGYALLEKIGMPFRKKTT